MAGNLVQIEDACSILEPYIPYFRNTVRNSFATYMLTPPQVRIDHDRRAVGACIHSHIVHEADRIFSGVDGAQVIDSQGLHLVLIEGCLACHFKLVDRYGRASFHRTMQQDAFESQSLELPHLERAPTSLRVGIVLDDVVSRVEHLLVIMPNGGAIAWKAMIGMEDNSPGWTDVTEQQSFKLAVVAAGMAAIKSGAKKTA